MSDETPTPDANPALEPHMVAVQPIRVLLIDAREENLILRSAILRQKGYQVVPANSIEQAQATLHEIDIAVLDYHLGAGKLGTAVAGTARKFRSSFCQLLSSADSAGLQMCTCSRGIARLKIYSTRCAPFRPRNVAVRW